MGCFFSGVFFFTKKKHNRHFFLGGDARLSIRPLVPPAAAMRRGRVRRSGWRRTCYHDRWPRVRRNASDRRERESSRSDWVLSLPRRCCACLLYGNVTRGVCCAGRGAGVYRVSDPVRRRVCGCLIGEGGGGDGVRNRAAVFFFGAPCEQKSRENGDNMALSWWRGSIDDVRIPGDTCIRTALVRAHAERRKRRRRNTSRSVCVKWRGRDGNANAHKKKRELRPSLGRVRPHIVCLRKKNPP